MDEVKDGQSLGHWLGRECQTCWARQRCRGAGSSCLLQNRWKLKQKREETILPSFSPLTPSLAPLNSQLGAPYLLQHYNSLGGHFRPIKPASRDSTFSLSSLLPMPHSSRSVISTLDANALSLISLVDSTIGADKEGIGKKHPVAFLTSSSLPLLRPR